jgi:lipopolysaccharide transport system ATP-binding protein
MSNTVIKVENISKMYDLGLVGTGTLSKDLNRTWARWTGKPDPYAKIAELNDRTKKSESGSVWVLKDISFEVKQGEVLGIIGKNGAGKSTLLKILSKITAPTHGQIKIKGRVASLLEVGTGMHPEMTARQNIYLNGSIMGMRRNEITAKLDEIVDFAGIGKYIDTPIKRFSSGMQVRLGFAVAAFLEPEILIVDEVLAVGDDEFQKKAIGKMQDVSKGEGRTVLFVSHNMAAVRALCTRALLLKNGTLDYEGSVDDTLNRYLKTERAEGVSLLNREDREGNKKVIVSEIVFKNKNNEIVQEVFSGDSLRIEFYLHENQKMDYSKMIVACSFTDPNQKQIVSWVSDEMKVNFDKNMNPQFCLEIPNLNLRPNSYDFNVQISFETTATADITDIILEAATLTINDSNFFQSSRKLRNNHSALIFGTFKTI